jgi:xylulose-5-phosphate/fructose-6-phosphate phosphoketolase
MANPLLHEPLKKEHVKPRLLGHWGTSPGLNLVYVHLNRLIKQYDLNVVYMAGPGHGGPALVANVYLEGTYTEHFPHITQDQEGMLKLFRQFSTPGGIPSHVSAPTPGSIHEGGELGHVLVHAFGAAFDNPDLIVAAVVGDGEAETGPLEGSWKGNKLSALSRFRSRINVHRDSVQAVSYLGRPAIRALSECARAVVLLRNVSQSHRLGTQRELPKVLQR